MMALCDGDAPGAAGVVEDHKAVGDGDVGPEHGRHGDVVAVGAGRRRARSAILETLFVPTVRALTEAGGRSAGCSTAG
jgi:phosphoribosylamine-glycine ligase